MYVPHVKTRKVAVLGFRAVGKSSLTIRFIDDVFIQAYNPTIEATFNKTFDVDGSHYHLEVADTAGQDDYSILHSQYALGIHGYILVYSVASKNSFETLKIIRDKILNVTGAATIPCVLVGNKSDLQFERQVPREQGQALADSWGCAFVESSAKHNERVEDIFKLIIREIEKTTQHYDMPAESGCCCTIM
ncbi:GTP-binding protein rhb1 [Thecamonas trahens ATCC 50062]|uniref:GTP-binding protein rhb1 n=1 Tax=Thecamonas trahens ATCC 50062 TaxID=461836 RepID=A0A0L0D3F6_THETB|nr:GTP-binding protein rhb1 [Thecamonas trahens ATCC 50062]KNC46839.1 GTP-binding protein rhb1 [Thecamonas trahens ATCC 50062]|eukprot:XP_013760112.1 GTP-binding protein rhb1 [Thecamonas trahens ATCC 50062]